MLQIVETVSCFIVFNKLITLYVRVQVYCSKVTVWENQHSRTPWNSEVEYPLAFPSFCVPNKLRQTLAVCLPLHWSQWGTGSHSNVDTVEINTNNEEEFVLQEDKSESLRFYSLAPGKSERNFRHVIFKQNLVIDGWGISCEIALIWMSLDFYGWWSVNIDSGNGLVPSGNKPLPEPMLIKISNAKWRH